MMAQPTDTLAPDSLHARPVYVLGGQVLAAAEPTRYSTVLGSCVAICLYDFQAQVGGINHIQMPGEPKRDDKEANRWAGPATRNLISMLVELGARRGALRAKIFGGATINGTNVSPELRIGDQNVASVVSLLRQERIRTVNGSTGGNSGRKVIFDSHTGNVWVKTLGMNLTVPARRKAQEEGVHHVE